MRVLTGYTGDTNESTTGYLQGIYKDGVTGSLLNATEVSASWNDDVACSLAGASWIWFHWFNWS